LRLRRHTGRGDNSDPEFASFRRAVALSLILDVLHISQSRLEFDLMNDENPTPPNAWMRSLAIWMAILFSLASLSR
jgi:hypothetical protein